MDQPAVITKPVPNIALTSSLIATIPPPTVVLTITADGVMRRGATPIEDLPKDELVTVVRELVDLIRKK